MYGGDDQFRLWWQWHCVVHPTEVCKREDLSNKFSFILIYIELNRVIKIINIVLMGERWISIYARCRHNIMACTLNNVTIFCTIIHFSFNILI